jgi:muramoyltetrapeptide carboxypeptidase
MGMRKQIKPGLLKAGDTIGIVAPSSPFDRDKLETGCAVLHAMGFKTRLARGLFESNGHLAGDDLLRADQLVRTFQDDAVQAVMCARGGFGALRILEQLDYAGIATHPKPFVGFSDATALHRALFQQIGLVTFHGPVVCSLATADEATRNALQAALCRPGPLRLSAADPLTLHGGVAQGIVLGGNLATLCHLSGTAFAGGFEGAILFIEDTNEAPYRIDRMLTQMKMTGVLNKIAGVAIGYFSGCGASPEIHAVMADCFDDLGIPVAAGFPVGHAERNLTFPLGLTARLDADKGELCYLEETF